MLFFLQFRQQVRGAERQLRSLTGIVKSHQNILNLSIMKKDSAQMKLENNGKVRRKKIT